ncbi:two component transcriptional regulator, LuxR family [Parasphingorhabdus marina DSM 22363]|uniref:Two component transcriptional regulator, LuxR family n=2 Tax=Parasphingorhabdus marina TaxID=394732 RepID=A0A1N6D0H2_9SPHN|nr:two component transcriptional regulator, LuxR family [Parasphingorhabdus marina DSM 22363]
MGQTAYSIILVDDHDVVRQGIKMLLENHGSFDVVAECADGGAGLEKAKQLVPDIILLDISMPDVTGIEILEEVRRWCPETRIAILTGLTSRKLLAQAWENGVDGIFLKTSNSRDLAHELKLVCEGNRRLPPEVAELLDEEKGQEKLTQREAQILFAIARGETNATIARRLGISANTVDNHRSNIMRKLGAHSVAELLALALREGLLDSAKQT